MIKLYFLNFFIYWYQVKLKDIIQKSILLWTNSLVKTNVIPMVTNIFTPMYQDQSIIGKFLSFITRIIWVFFGSIYQILLLIPLVVIVILWLILPVLCVVQVIRSII